MSTFLWVIVAYISIAVFIGGHVWRYRYDKFGWTTRSSQLYENRLLRLGSPLFHFGILLVVLGHIGGILIPSRPPRQSASPRLPTTPPRSPSARSPAS